MRIASWNVNGLYTTLKDAAARHTSASHYFSQVLNADIVCFQEAKIQEEKLEKWMACVAGYDSHWAFSQIKKGYSGVVTYVKEEFSPVDARADWLGENSVIATEGLCNEGRLMYTDHGSFVLLNVYVPNAGDHEDGRPRLDFKLRYLEALQQICDELVRSGRHFVIVGDFNVAYKDIDVHARWKVEECYSLEEREWMDGFFSKYIDLYRHFHPDARDVFSVWNQKTEARMHNEGLRIDYAVCDKGFLPQVMETDVVKMVPKNWSDHAAVFVVLKEQPTLDAHPAPALSSRNMKRFHEDHRQKKLTALFSKGSKPPVSAPDHGKSPEAKVCKDTWQPRGEELEGYNHPVKEGNSLSVEQVAIPTQEPKPACGGTSEEAVFTTVTKQEDAASFKVVEGSGNDEMRIKDSKPAVESKKFVVQTKGKEKSAVKKRKAEAATLAKGAGSKQRSLGSFFKAKNAE